MVDKFGNLLAPSLPFGDHANMQYRTSDGLFFYDNSSRRYKRNIRPLRTDFRLILQAEPKTYTRPADPDRWEVGYIAEEMDSLGLTELVSYDKKGIPDGFNYEKMILYVNEILKDHDAQLHELHLKLEQRDKLIEKQAAVIELLLSREQYGVSADRQMTEAAQK